jgi:hypothetical protein
MYIKVRDSSCSCFVPSYTLRWSDRRSVFLLWLCLRSLYAGRKGRKRKLDKGSDDDWERCCSEVLCASRAHQEVETVETVCFKTSSKKYSLDKIRCNTCSHIVLCLHCIWWHTSHVHQHGGMLGLTGGSNFLKASPTDLASSYLERAELVSINIISLVGIKTCWKNLWSDLLWDTQGSLW